MGSTGSGARRCGCHIWEVTHIWEVRGQQGAGSGEHEPRSGKRLWAESRGAGGEGGHDGRGNWVEHAGCGLCDLL